MSANLPVKSPFYKYARLVSNSSDYAKRMNRLSNKIFSESVRPPSGSVVERLSVKPLDLRPDIVNYYPRHIEIHSLMMTLRSYGLFRDEHEDFAEEMDRVRELKGKGKKARIARILASRNKS